MALKIWVGFEFKWRREAWVRWRRGGIDALKLLIGFGFRWRRNVWVRGLERGREQVRKKEKREKK